jgi:hypothetical protein
MHGGGVTRDCNSREVRSRVLIIDIKRLPRYPANPPFLINIKKKKI